MNGLLTHLLFLGALLTRIQTLTNPLKLITHPSNKVEVDIRLQVYIIKIQKQSLLGIARIQGGDTTVTLCRSPLVDLKNSFFEWNDQVFGKGRKMTKEEFMKHDWKFNESFGNFKFLKDSYDGLKMLPLPKVFNNVLIDKSQSTVQGVEATISYMEQIEFVALDLNTKVQLKLT